ncbi:3'(2'),5'-bisphosphate nucleotidase 1 [Drosophila grimshawi]|uniref:3'(2'),5'-bisphosphate nucleotidase 1 n=1 Tax=Drosophila grimshawi TaxID=7222 RepID=B4JRJ7_DROGR|nr:3'(2'),5'-bisphosphate nucleotidase 1 [Drosophila grimshawi]EDV94387.1 GH19967 [Drosophila grimshawi]
MASSTPLIMRIMALSINTAKRAGGIIRDVLKQGDLGIVDKGMNDPQTEADRSAQRCIIASLAKKFPSIQIIGEEGGSDLNVCADWLVGELDEAFLKQNCPTDWQHAQPEDFVIWVDPLDGTAEYTQGHVEHVTVLIGIAIKNSAVGGIIHQPFYKQSSGELGRTIWGLKGLGTGGFTSVKPPAGEFIITTTRSHSNALHQRAVDVFNASKVLKVGGAGFKVLQLLEGKAHAYVFATPGCKKWDTCAPEAVLEANGGTLTNINGEHYEYNADVEHVNRRGVLASSGDNHTELVEKIPIEVRQAVGTV